MWLRLFLTILILILSSYSAMAHNKILEGMEPNSITIIGERHQRSEAIQFFQSIVTKYLQQDKCLTIGLEIPSNQQPLLDKMKQGEAVISDIEIPPTIDHQQLRKLMSDLVAIQKQNACLKLIAIDGWIGLDMGRDERMAKILNDQVSQAPILALLGSLHTFEKSELESRND